MTSEQFSASDELYASLIEAKRQLLAAYALAAAEFSANDIDTLRIQSALGRIAEILVNWSNDSTNSRYNQSEKPLTVVIESVTTDDELVTLEPIDPSEQDEPDTELTKQVNNILTEAGLSEAYRDTITLLIQNPGQPFAPKELHEQLPNQTQTARRSAFNSMITKLKDSPFADQLTSSGKTHSRRYTWTIPDERFEPIEPTDIPEVDTNANKPIGDIAQLNPAQETAQSWTERLTSDLMEWIKGQPGKLISVGEMRAYAKHHSDQPIAVRDQKLVVQSAIEQLAKNLKYMGGKDEVHYRVVAAIDTQPAETKLSHVLSGEVVNPDTNALQERFDLETILDASGQQPVDLAFNNIRLNLPTQSIEALRIIAESDDGVLATDLFAKLDFDNLADHDNAKSNLKNGLINGLKDAQKIFNDKISDVAQLNIASRIVTKENGQKATILHYSLNQPLQENSQET